MIKKLIYTLIIVFFVATTLSVIISSLSDEYGISYDDSDLKEIDNMQPIFNDITNMSNKVQSSESINILTIGSTIWSAIKIMFNVPGYFITLTASLIGFAELPSSVIFLVNISVVIAILFSMLYLIFGRKL